MSTQAITTLPPDLQDKLTEMFRQSDERYRAMLKESEEKYVALRKELDEKAAAEQKVAEERAAAERKAAEERSEKRAEERAARAAAERKAAEEKSEAERKAERKAWNKRYGYLTDTFGRIVLHMVKGGIVEKFRELGYEFTQYSKNTVFHNKRLGIKGEIDLFLEDGPIAMLVEVKTTLEIKDVKEHIERLEKYSRYAKLKGDNRTFVAAVAGAAAEENVIQFAQENGMFVIVQSGKATTLVTSPEGFKAKEW